MYTLKGKTYNKNGLKIMSRWLIYCEESGDKGIPWRQGASNFYVVTAILVREDDEQSLRDVIHREKYKVLRLKRPLEWKQLSTREKKDDKNISRFLRKVADNGPEFLVSTVVCNKHETSGPGFIDRNVFMNYLYGLMFKRISWFLHRTGSTAKLTIDRNTDKIAQESLKTYISDVTRYQTGTHPRHSKPKWLNPEDHEILGLADFVSGVSLRSLSDYRDTVAPPCNACMQVHCIYECSSSNFNYKRSYKNVVSWNERVLSNWHWRGLLYHPYEFKDNYKHLFEPK
jgi:Protein of unknown function (DUF3800)